jgi:hypothetical protein
MTHLIVTSTLLFALLAIVGIALGACLGIARDTLLEGGAPEGEEYWAPDREPSPDERSAGTPTTASR